MAGLACTTPYPERADVPPHSHPYEVESPRSTNQIQAGGAFEDRGLLLFVTIADSKLPKMGATLEVSSTGELWLGIPVCWTQYQGEMLPYSGYMADCDAGDREGQTLVYKLADYPATIDGQ